MRSFSTSLYEYDFDSVNTSEQIFTTCSNAVSDYNTGRQIVDIASQITSLLDSLGMSWKKRLDSVENILVTK